MTKLRNVAIVGFAQLPIVARDEHRMATEMLYPAVRQALNECGVNRDAIDFQIAGSTDYMDGRPFGFVAALDMMGSWPPRQDLHLEMDSSFCAYYAWVRMQAGDCDTAIVAGHGKGSEGEFRRVQHLQLDPYYQAQMGLDPVATSALQASAYMARTGVVDRDLATIAARNRTAGTKNPDNQLRKAATADELSKGAWSVEPLRETYLPPVGETATCLVLAAEGKAEKMCDKPVWIHGVDHRTEMQSLGARDLSRSASTKLAGEKAMQMAGLARANDVDLVELSSVTPIEELILCEALGLDTTAARPVINPSGGPICGNPIMMTGGIRMGEAFRQLAQRAGERQVANAKRALAQASQGHCMQQSLVWVLGTDRRWS